MFESSVNPEGSETQAQARKDRGMFESSVNPAGSETVKPFCRKLICV